MDILISTIIFTGLFLLFFILYSKFSKKEDYLLDDYGEDELPDNVRIIKKEVEVPVEVIKEVEVPVEVIKEVEVPVEVIKEVEVPVEVIKEVEIERNNEEGISKAISDRDYFINLYESTKEELDKIKAINKSLNSQLNFEDNNMVIYEGVDEYGKFYDMSIIDDKFPEDQVKKIYEIYDNIEVGQFAYYVINLSTDFENFNIHDINKLDSFIKITKKKREKGKYTIYIILSNRVYHYEIH